MKHLGKYPSVHFPLLLLQEGEVRSRLEGLGLRGKTTDREAGLEITGRRTRFRVRSFGGQEADLNAVLDSIMA